MKPAPFSRTAWKEIEFTPVLLGSLLLGMAAWQNMFPLLYPDSGSYISSGLRGHTAIDRPLLYGLFIRHTSMRATLWFTLIAQCLIVSSVLFAFVKSIFFSHRYKIIYYLLLIPLIGCTALSIKSSTLIPDAFTPLPALCLYVLYSSKQNIIIRSWFIAITTFSICVHQSHLVIFILAGFLFAIVHVLRYGGPSTWNRMKSAWFVLPILIGSFFLTPLINLKHEGEFYWSRAGGIFLMGKFSDNGMLEKYLLDNCDHLSLEMCNYKHDITTDFLWDDRSPIHKMGGWEHPSPEYDAIAYDIITTPKYFIMLCYKSLADGFVQFFQFNISTRAENAPMGVNSAPYYAVRDVFKHEMNHYFTSNQNSERLNYDNLNNRQSYFMIALLVLYFAIRLTSLGHYLSELKKIFCFLMCYMIANALVCGALSIPNPRYQTRVFWLLPLIIMMMLIKLWLDHKKEIKAMWMDDAVQ